MSRQRTALRRAALVVAAVATTAVAPVAAHGQDVPINQRFTTPTAHAETYAGLTLSQLVLALGLSLQGVPHEEMQRDLGRRLDGFEIAGHVRQHGSNGAPTHAGVPRADTPADP